MRLLRKVAAVVALTCSTWASVVDNPAICPDEMFDEGGAPEHGTPVGSHCCMTAPCRTPAISPAPAGLLEPLRLTVAPSVASALVLSGIDAPAPATPPPTSFDLA